MGQNEVTYTTTGRFPVVDITHHSKRTQEGNLNNRPDRIYVSEETTATPTQQEQGDVPRAITVENAIDYYTNKKTGNIQLAKLYSATAVWLGDYLRLKNLKEGKIVEESDEELAKRIEEELNEEMSSEKEG